MDLGSMMCDGILAVLTDLQSQFEYKYNLAEMDYIKVTTALKNMTKELVNGSYSNPKLPTESQIDSTVIDLIKLAQVYDNNGINFGALGQLGIGVAMSGVSFDLASGQVTQAPEWLVKKLLDNIDEVIKSKLGTEAGTEIITLIKAAEVLENDISLSQIQTITMQADILSTQCPTITGYLTGDIIISRLALVGLDETLNVKFQEITDDLFPIVNDIVTNYFDSTFLKKMAGLKLAYRIVRNLILTSLKRNPNAYWNSERIKDVNNYDVSTS